MKRQMISLLLVCMVLLLTACTNPTYEEPVGNDWHAWGVYDFMYVGELSVGIGRAFDAENQCVGYDIYADGETQGALLGEIRFADGGCTSADFDLSGCFVSEDYNQDGRSDIGVRTTGGDILWYLRDENNHFAYAELQRGGDAG